MTSFDVAIQAQDHIHPMTSFDVAIQAQGHIHPMTSLDKSQSSSAPLTTFNL